MHRPTVYTLPKNSKLENVQKLETIADVEGMRLQLAKDITSIMGIPFELIGGGYSTKQGEKKALENGRVFTTNMMTVCSHLQNLLREVYVATYGGHPLDVEFVLRATPRIEIQSVEEIAALLETGIISFENAMDISNMLLGVTLKQATGKDASAGQFSRAYITPSNKKDLIVASKAENKPSAGNSSSKK